MPAAVMVEVVWSVLHHVLLGGYVVFILVGDAKEDAN